MMKQRVFRHGTWAAAALALGLTLLAPQHSQATSFTFTDANCASFNLVNNGGGSFSLQCSALTCSIVTAPGATVAPGNPISLTASCTGGDGAQTYAWSLASGGDPSCPSTSGTTNQISVNDATATASPCTYKVAVSDGANGGGSAQQTVSWGNALVAPSGCNITGLPGVSEAAPYTYNLSVSCSGGGAPTAYQWSGGSASTAQQITGSIGGTTTFNVVASNGAGAAPQASGTITVSGGGGGGGQFNCHALNGSVSGNTTTINENWASPTTNVPAPMGPNDAIVVVFTTGSSTSANYSRLVAGEWAGTNPTTRIAVLSPNPCDWTNGVPGPNFYTHANNSQLSFYFNVGQPSPNNFPELSPNTTYYLNVMNAPNPSCAANGACEMFFSLYKGNGL
jgi:hypothetical protein